MYDKHNKCVVQEHYMKMLNILILKICALSETVELQQDNTC